jgi:DNA repair protein RadC
MANARKIHDIPLIDRPREKLQRKGEHALSDFELLEVMIGSGNATADVGSIAQRLLKLLRAGTESLSLEALTSVPGVNIAQASKLLASLELARRHLVRDVQPLKTQSDILVRLSDIRAKQQEYFVCLSLDGGQRLIAQRTVTIGTLDTVLAHPREVFADPLIDRAAYVIVAHNHPSGDVEPSQKDLALTQQLVAAGQLLGIPLHDHIIVTKTEYVSLRARKLL